MAHIPAADYTRHRHFGSITSRTPPPASPEPTSLQPVDTAENQIR